MKLNLQQFGGRGSGSGGGGDLLGKSARVGKIGEVRDMLSERSSRQTETDDVLSVGRRMTGLYGGESAVNQFQIAKVGGGTMAYYDADGNLAMNEKYMNAEGMNRAYDAAVKNGFHPSRGNLSGIQAVAAHEYGHALTDLAAQRMGLGGFGGIGLVLQRKFRKEGKPCGYGGSEQCPAEQRNKIIRGGTKDGYQNQVC